VQRGLQLLAGSEVVALQHLLDAAVESLDHAVRLRRFWRGQAVLDPELGAKRVELVLARRRALAQTEEPIGEFLAVVGEDRTDPHRAGPFRIAQEAASVGRGLSVEYGMKTHRVARSITTNRCRCEDSSAI